MHFACCGKCVTWGGPEKDRRDDTAEGKAEETDGIRVVDFYELICGHGAIETIFEKGSLAEVYHDVVKPLIHSDSDIDHFLSKCGNLQAFKYCVVNLHGCRRLWRPVTCHTSPPRPSPFHSHCRHSSPRSCHPYSCPLRSSSFGVPCPPWYRVRCVPALLEAACGSVDSGVGEQRYGKQKGGGKGSFYCRMLGSVAMVCVCNWQRWIVFVSDCVLSNTKFFLLVFTLSPAETFCE